MHIWIDGQCFQTGSRDRGIGRYVTGLLQALGRQPDIRLTVSLNASLPEEAISARNWLKIMVPQADTTVWYANADRREDDVGFNYDRMVDEQILATHINAIAPDVALSPSPFEGTPDSTSPFLLTESVEALTACIFHDAIPHRYAERYITNLPTASAYYRRLVAISRFDVVLTNSEFTANEYRDILGGDNAVAIDAGLSETFQTLLDNGQDIISSMLAEKILHNRNELKKSSTPFPFILYVGALDWRKNVPFLFTSISELPEPRRSKLRLVIAGAPDNNTAKIMREAWHKHDLPIDNLLFTNWISDADLVWLYKHAAVAIQPSFMEGFGLSALEAMAAGCPFLAARGGAVAEVVGRDDQLFDPTKPQELSNLMTRLLEDEAFRTDIVTYGHYRAKYFTWARSAHIAQTALAEGLKNSRAAKHIAQAAPPPLHRLIVDVTETTRTPFVSGIQRVMHRLSSELVAQATAEEEVVLSYCRHTNGWFRLNHLTPSAVTMAPQDRLDFRINDSYLMFDSSWGFTHAQKQRLIEALADGQEVIHGVYDIGPLTMPAWAHFDMPPIFRAWFEFVLGHSTAILCISRAVADEVAHLVEALQTPRPLKIGYMQLGSDFSDGPVATEWFDTFTNRPTFLMVGTIEPRKGHRIVLAAMEQLWSEGYDVNLLLIGKPGWSTDIFQKRLAAHPEAEHRLFVRDDVSDAQLRAAYGHATALLMASYLEGFGLPVVEAGRFGCPAVLSDIPVFREVGEGAPAARYFRPEDPDDLADVLRDVLVNGFNLREAAPWPTWAETATSLRTMIRENRWYRHYQPKVIEPNIYCQQVGNVQMERPLPPGERDHRLRYVEGPLLIADAGVICLAVALRNDCQHIWSSRGQSDGNLGINLGVHYYDNSGNCVDYDGGRVPIPFVLLPGDEIYLSVRVPIDHIAKGVVEVGCEMVQEGHSWFEDELRLNLLTVPSSPLEQIDGPVGHFADLEPFVLRAPFYANKPTKNHLLLGMLNNTRQTIIGGTDSFASALRAQFIDSQGHVTGEAKISNGFTSIGPSSYGLVMLEASTDDLHMASALEITLIGPVPIRWKLDCATLQFDVLENSQPVS